MGFEEHKNKKFQYGNPYADYEYVNKNSRKTLPGLIFALLFGLAILFLAWWRWHELTLAEETGGTVSLTSVEWGLYKLTGKWGAPALLAVIAVILIYSGIKNYFRLEKMKRS